MTSIAPETAVPPDFLQLPINADEGFPQAFRFVLGTRTYVLTLQVDVAEELLAGATTLVLPQPGAFMVASVSRDDPAGSVVLFRRKLVPGLIYDAGELALTVRSMVVDVRNLNSPGTYGSQVVAGVASR